MDNLDPHQFELLPAGDNWTVIGNIILPNDTKQLIEANCVDGYVRIRPNYMIDQHGVRLHSFSLEIINPEP